MQEIVDKCIGKFIDLTLEYEEPQNNEKYDKIIVNKPACFVKKADDIFNEEEEGEEQIE